jgi:two-component system, response regulator
MTSPNTILLVEDSDDDAELTAMALKEARVSNPLVRVCDGVEALDYLCGKGKYAGRDMRETPAVVLLDLNLPRRNGLEVLQAIRHTDGLRHIPVVILTSSTEDKDRLAAYTQYANSYVQKPVDYDQFVAAARQLGLYWMVLNVPPPNGAG